ncbi:unnamed protein product [Effrenium voratum]|uniref:Solute carrier family 35 member B1 n=1 Tax=Effrenium voratum TaxID=2562239 RepID=A0AA36J220_9DINO|nr:unnamed protein product [Effrenium voratum]CAJ1417176.1 unnamed protein product [Effrenium voratum]
MPSAPSAMLNPHFKDLALLRRGVFYALGIIVFLLIYGTLQERIMTRPYGDQVFNSSIFLVLCNRAVAAICALCAVCWRREPVTNGAPCWQYALVSFSNVCASVCQYEALKYVSFAVQMLGKCFKMMPVMLWGMAIDGKRYSLTDWAVAAAVTAGVMQFLVKGPTGSYRQNLPGEGGPTGRGYLLLLAFLLLDGLTSTLQEKLFKEHRTTKFNQMLYTNIISSLISSVMLIASGQATSSVNFLLHHSDFATDTAVLSASAVASQCFIYSQVQEFGALAFAATMNVRQVSSIIFSYVRFGHYITSSQIVGLVLIFSALFYKCLTSWTVSKSEKQRLVQEPKEAPEDSAERNSARYGLA